MAANSGPEKAQHLASILWEHHEKHGRVTIADIKGLVDIPCDSLYKTFQCNKVEAPPIWDSQKEKMRRKVQALTDEAERLGQSGLTKDQAAQTLGIKPSRVSGVITQIVKRGFSAPDISNNPEALNKSDKLSQIVDEERFQMNGTVNPYWYPAGLQVLSYWDGPEPRDVTYLLR